MFNARNLILSGLILLAIAGALLFAVPTAHAAAIVIGIVGAVLATTAVVVKVAGI
jgi:hypothetical protein